MSTQFDIALALSIVKTKPSNVSIQDYIATLRRHITIQPGTHRRHIDCKAVWYNLHQQSQDQLRVEQNKIFALEKENEALKARLHASQTGTTCPAGSSTKRKRTEQHGSSPRKSKTAHPSHILDPLSLGLDFDVIGSSQPGLTALRNMHKLHKMMHGAMYAVIPAHMSDTIIDAARALSHIIDELPEKLQKTKQRPGLSEDELSATLIAISRIFTTILHALKRLHDLPKSEQVIGNTVYYCVETVNSIFTTMEAAATTEAKSPSTTHSIKPTKSSKVSVSSAATNRHLLLGLTNLTRSFLDILDTDHVPTHASLLEGLLHLLFTSLGEIVHLIAFSGPRSDSINQEILTLPPSNPEISLDPARVLERRAMLTEAPYKLSILKKAIATTPTAFKRRMPEGLAGKYYLVPSALRRLQRTLVDCVFGAGTRGEGASREVLRLPRLKEPVVIPDEAAVVGSEKKRERAEDWFEGELWATVGWEILGEEEEL